MVATLKTIETKVAQIVATFGVPEDSAPAPLPPPSSGDGLLQGPQLPDAAMDQSDIDKLLASFE